MNRLSTCARYIRSRGTDSSRKICSIISWYLPDRVNPSMKNFLPLSSQKFIDLYTLSLTITGISYFEFRMSASTASLRDGSTWIGIRSSFLQLIEHGTLRLGYLIVVRTQVAGFVPLDALDEILEIAIEPRRGADVPFGFQEQVDGGIELDARPRRIARFDQTRSLEIARLAGARHGTHLVGNIGSSGRYAATLLAALLSMSEEAAPRITR